MSRNLRLPFHLPSYLPGLDLFRLLLAVAIILYIALFTNLAFDLHNSMRTHRSDLGQIAQAVWNSSQGRFVEMTDNGFVATRMTDHVEPILAVISPVFWLWQDVRALLLLQVILVAVGAWPLYELALQRLDLLLSPRERKQIWQIEPLRQLTRPLALTLAIAYLLTPQLQSALLTEFHAAPLAVPFILWAFWAVNAQRPWHFLIATLLVAITKEEMALLAAGLALWQLWRSWYEGSDSEGGNKSQFAIRSAALLFMLSLVWFYVATFVIVPAHSAQIYNTEQSVYFSRYGALGTSPLDIAKNFVTQPQLVWQIAIEPARRNYLWGLLAPFGLFSLLAPEVLLLALPLLFANLFSTYPAQYYGEFHYSAPLIPYVAVAATYGLARLWCWVGHYTGATSASYQHMAAANTAMMALISLVTNGRTALRPLVATGLSLWLLTWASITYLHAGRGPWSARYDPVVTNATEATHYRLLPYFLAQIPQEAAVTATAAVHPHLSLRRYIYQFPLGLPELEREGHATWALIDVTTNTDMAPGDLKATVDTMLTGEWGIVDGADGFLLLRRGAATKTIPDSFYDFARVVNDNEQSLIDVPVTTQLVKTDVSDWPRWRQIKVSAEWLVGEDSLTGALQPELEIVTPDGEILKTLMSMAPPALVWYPPTVWQPGEQVRITSLPLWLPRIWGIRTDNPIAGERQIVTSADSQQALVANLHHDKDGIHEIRFPSSSPPFATATQLSSVPSTFVDSEGNPLLSLQVWGTPHTVAPGDLFILWLRWRGNQWPSGKTVFVHLRVDDQTIIQRDGPPRYFVYYEPSALLAERGLIDDLRQLQIPVELLPGTTISLVAGLYDVENGMRVPLVDGTGVLLGEEWRLGEFTVEPTPIPDQACAMIPDSCVTQ